MTMKLFLLAAALGALLWPAAVARAQVDERGADNAFLRDAWQAGHKEVRLAKLARDKAVNASVRRFAQRMVDDHTTANKQLQDFVDVRSVDLPREMSREDRVLFDRLNALEGKAFDSEYMRRMVADHVKVLTRFENEMDGGRDASVRSWTTRQVPILREHLRMARAVAEEVK
jgi:putative membrane protein